MKKGNLDISHPFSIIISYARFITAGFQDGMSN